MNRIKQDVLLPIIIFILFILSKEFSGFVFRLFWDC